MENDLNVFYIKNDLLSLAQLSPSLFFYNSIVLLYCFSFFDIFFFRFLLPRGYYCLEVSLNTSRLLWFYSYLRTTDLTWLPDGGSAVLIHICHGAGCIPHFVVHNGVHK